MTHTLTSPDIPAAHTWDRALRRGMLAYLLSRIFVLLGVGVGITAHAIRDRWDDKVPVQGPTAVIRALDAWDGPWYMDVARSGYPRHIMANVSYVVSDARAAFFPLFPRTVHYLDVILPGGPVSVALLLNFVLGGAFVWLTGRISRELFDERTAEKAMVLVSFFPGSFVLSYAYSEAMMLTICALVFIALSRRRWVLAGLLAAAHAGQRREAPARDAPVRSAARGGRDGGHLFLEGIPRLAVRAAALGAGVGAGGVSPGARPQGGLARSRSGFWHGES